MSLLKIEPQNTHDLILLLETYFSKKTIVDWFLNTRSIEFPALLWMFLTSALYYDSVPTFHLYVRSFRPSNPPSITGYPVWFGKNDLLFSYCRCAEVA